MERIWHCTFIQLWMSSLVASIPIEQELFLRKQAMMRGILQKLKLWSSVCINAYGVSIKPLPYRPVRKEYKVVSAEKN